MIERLSKDARRAVATATSNASADLDVDDAEMDPSSRLVILEARRRGIDVRILSPKAELYCLRFNGRAVSCREALSELTSAEAIRRCDDKRVTARLLAEAGLSVPAQMLASSEAENLAFLKTHGSVVVKPVRGEQGRGVSVDIRTPEALAHAIESAKNFGGIVALEQFVTGEDVRLIVIDDELVAAAVRRPPRVTGNGKTSVRHLIDAQSRRRQSQTRGHSKIPIDDETLRCISTAGYDMDDVLPRGVRLTVRRAANLHTGGTISDITADVHFRIAEVARAAARVLGIPVVGLDMILPDLRGSSYWIIEANERPGLANHEPQPTASRFVDFLFPETAARARAGRTQ